MSLYCVQIIKVFSCISTHFILTKSLLVEIIIPILWEFIIFHIFDISDVTILHGVLTLCGM